MIFEGKRKKKEGEIEKNVRKDDGEDEGEMHDDEGRAWRVAIATSKKSLRMEAD